MGGECPVNAPVGKPASECSIRASERQRISRDLHDSTSQLLVALQLQVCQLRNCPGLGAEPLLDEIAETLQSIRDSIKQIESETVDERTFELRRVQTAKIFVSLARMPTR
ncbi:histidine kinase [Sphingomonas hankyongi]|uniref:histidine kinase n=1 Tax=Sphingomonas hankyongi TaxID=2908209 RepID=UPI003D349367